MDITTLLAPLRMIRGVSNVEFRDAVYDDLPPVFPYNEYWQHKEKTSILPSIDFQTNLRNLMMSSSPSEPLGDMFERLIDYAEAFERVERFKLDMRYGFDARMFISLEKQRHSYWSTYTAPTNPHAGARHSTDPINPVEIALARAREAWIKNFNPATFKTERAKVVNYLERQYKRVTVAAMNMANFVKSQKRNGRFIFPNLVGGGDYRWGIREMLAEAVLELESYERVFHRDVPFEERLAQRILAHENAPAYSLLPRNIILKQANDAFDAQQYHQFEEAFRKGVDDMDTQYLQIRSARKALFEADLTPDASCNIDLEIHRVDEMIDWSVPEPQMGPLNENEMRHFPWGS